MKQLTKLMVAVSVTLFGVIAPSQQGSSGNHIPVPPEELQKEELCRRLMREADHFFMQKRISEAIAKYREAVAVEDDLRDHTSSVKYRLAKALVVGGFNAEAMTVFQRGMKWDTKRGDWTINGPPIDDYSTDYAILAAKQGDMAKAKEIYYWAMRHLNRDSFRTYVPIPFLVVCDPDPTMDVWQYSEHNLIAALRC